MENTSPEFEWGDPTNHPAKAKGTIPTYFKRSLTQKQFIASDEKDLMKFAVFL